MRNIYTNIIRTFLVVITVFFASCEKKFDEYYKVPEDLIGTILEVLDEDGHYTQFIKAIELVEFNDVLGKTGNYTVFAPDDQAFQEFFTESGYSSLEQMPEEELKALVYYHIVFWSYSKFKLLYGLGVEDATIEYETDNFKKETRYKPPPTYEYNELGRKYRVYHEYKFIPVYSEEYFADHELNGSFDYNFFYPNTNYSGFQADRAEIVEADVPAQNGWIHKINKVLMPPDNHKQILAKHDEFSTFRSLIEERKTFEYSQFFTLQQPNEGDVNDDGILDTLYLEKNELLPYDYSFDFENTGGNGQSQLLTLIAPTNDAMNRFLAERTKGYMSIEDIGEYWMDWYLRHYIGLNYWPSKLSTMTEDWLTDLTYTLADGNINPGDIVFARMASNGPFIGINKYLLPRVFETVVRPIFGKRDYEWFSELLIHYMADILLNKEEIEFTVFAPNNDAISKAGYSAREGLGGFGLYADGNPLEPVPRRRATDIIKSHIVFGRLDEDAFEEGTFIKTIQNTYIGVEADGIFGGEDRVIATLGKPDESGINGVLYPINRMLISPGRNLLSTLTDQIVNPDFEEFHKLILKAGLIIFNEDFGYVALNNLSTGISYTCFVPTNQVIIEGIAKGLIPDDPQELNQFLRYHFVEGMVFSDGKQSGLFNTTRFADENQNSFNTIEIQNEKDNLRVVDNLGNVRHVTSANLMATGAVVHVIDSLLFFE